MAIAGRVAGWPSPAMAHRMRLMRIAMARPFEAVLALVWTLFLYLLIRVDAGSLAGEMNSGEGNIRP